MARTLIWMRGARQANVPLTLRRQGFCSHCPFLGPREGKGEVAFSDFCPLHEALGTPEKVRVMLLFRPHMGP